MGQSGWGWGTRTTPLVRRVLGVFGLGFLLSIFAWWPMIAAYPATQGGDGPPYHKTLEAARVSLVRYRELPLWNPYECGGLPLWDNPQGAASAPLIFPMFLLGTTATMYLWYLLHSAMGFASMWFLARDEVKLSRPATFVARSRSSLPSSRASRSTRSRSALAAPHERVARRSRCSSSDSLSWAPAT